MIYRKPGEFWERRRRGDEEEPKDVLSDEETKEKTEEIYKIMKEAKE